MKIIYYCMAILLSSGAYATECPPLLDFNLRTLNDQQQVHLCQAYQGKVLLVVNTASKCAYTDQYTALEHLYEQYQAQGLVVLGFPSNDFGAQEPGNEQQIISFCRLTYGVKFPMFAKSRVAENGADPFYVALARAAGGVYPQWNFHKYLIDVEGQLVASYPSSTDPMHADLIKQVKQQLKRVSF